MPTPDEHTFEVAEAKRSRLPATLAGLMVAAGVAAFVLAWGMHTGSIQGISPLHSGGLFAVGGVLVALAISVGVITMARRHKRKQDHVFEAGREALLAQGFEIEAKPDKALHKEYKTITRLTQGGRTTRAARGAIAGRDTLIFEHTHTVHTGHATVTVMNTVWIIDAPNWPSIEIKPRSAGGRLLYKLGFLKGLTLDDDEFNRAFRVRTSHAAFAVTLLSPDVQRLMLEERGIIWRIEPGRLCVMRQRPMKLDEIPDRAARLERFFALVPPELC